MDWIYLKENEFPPLGIPLIISIKDKYEDTLEIYYPVYFQRSFRNPNKYEYICYDVVDGLFKLNLNEYKVVAYMLLPNPCD